MSVHKSLRSRMSLARHRNVITRAERLEKLAQLGRWTEGSSVFGIPKTKVVAKIRRVKKKEKKEEAVAEGAEAAAAPAEGAEKEKDKEKKKEKEKG
ncbi:MAG: small basic protein [Planctomycetes bacterium]|nr:small basic protein [Planctomycetota bacterium]